MGLEERAQDREIDGVTYRSWPLPFGIGQKALLRTIRVLSPIMAVLTRGDQAAVFDVLPTALTDEDVAYFSDIFGKSSKYKDGENWVPLLTSAQELHFAGRYSAFMRWVVLNMEVNFAGFFDGKAGGMGVADLAQMFKKS